MSQQWRILVVEGDEYLNSGIVNSLLKDGYAVQGVSTGAEAIRILWADEQNLVIGDLQLTDADGFDLLQWIRTYRPSTRMIMLAKAGIAGARTRALENGAVGYLEKPVDLLLLKVEVRRLLQQTGFTASLASFDLLDVIQIVNMSRKSIALVVHTGLEEQGLLGFQSGELIWAEYGTLRGEEAFFALAAHKDGMVTQQPWNDRVTPNVVQPLSRLIMQALQYRAKYAAAQQLSGEYEAVKTRLPAPAESSPSPVDLLFTEEADDRPFTYIADAPASPAALESPAPAQPASAPGKEWWQDSARTPSIQKLAHMHSATGHGASASPAASNGHRHTTPISGSSITPSTAHKTPTGQRSDLPSWLMDQPTQFELQALKLSTLNGSNQATTPPISNPSLAVWQPGDAAKTPQTGRPTVPLVDLSIAASYEKAQIETTAASPGSNATQWQETQNIRTDAAVIADTPASRPQNPLKPRQTDELLQRETNERVISSAQVERPPATARQQSPNRRNYPALVSALQTLGYTLPGFVASAIVGMDGQPIAQVAMDDLDISALCGDFSIILQSALFVLRQESWGQHEDTIITSTTHHILLRVLDSGREVFQVLVTTRASDPVESLEVMITVESAILAAL